MTRSPLGTPRRRARADAEPPPAGLTSPPAGAESPPAGATPSAGGAAARQRRADGRHVAVGLVLLAVASAGSLFVGVTDLTPADVLHLDDHQTRVLVVSRVPRLVAILLAGTAMGVAGLIMQHLARNRFVAPSTAGTLESAQLGVLVATLLFGSASVLGKMTVAVAVALVGTGIFLALLRRITFRDVVLVPLVGLMFGGVLRSITQFVAYRTDLLQTVSAWMNGDFSGVLRGRYELLWVAAGVTLVAYLYADRFTVAGMGRDVSVNLGVAYDRVVNLGLAIVALVTGVVVVTVGSIPFLDLVVPNLVVGVLGDNLRRALPFTALTGAGLVLASDVVGRVIRFPYEIPVGTVVGVVGSAIFLALLMRRSARG